MAAYLWGNGAMAAHLGLAVLLPLLPLSAALQPALEVDVAIVGAGYSGLAAARRLQREGPGVTFHVLEARDRPGGRTLNRDVVTGAESQVTDDVIELGAEWLAPEHTEAIRLFRDELGFDLFHRMADGPARRPRRRPRGRRPRAAAAGGEPHGEPHLPPCPGQCPIVLHTSTGTVHVGAEEDQVERLPAEAQRQIGTAERELFRQVAQTPCSGPLSNPDAAELDSLSFAAWLRQHAPSEEAQAHMASYGDDAEALDQISTLDVAFVLNCTAGVVGSDYEDYYRVRGGTQGPALRLSEGLGGAERLTLSSPVRAVSRLDGGRWEVRSDRRTLLARHVLFAGLPPALLLGIAFEPALPGAIAQLLQRLPLGTCMKYSVVYRTAWWRARGFLGNIQSFSANQSSGPASPYTSLCYDNSPYSWGRGVITCFMVGDQNRAFLQDLAPEQRSAHVIDYIARSFGGRPPADGSADILDIVALDWADEPYSRGAYSTFHMPGVLTSAWPALAPIYAESRFGPDGLWLCGADWFPEMVGYMEGALRSGRLAAERIVGDLQSHRQASVDILYA